MKLLHYIAFALVVIGGLNWGLYALGYNLVNMLLGSWPMVEKVVYLLVGLSAIYLGVTHKGDCKVCSMGSMDKMA
jgi:hypothetical protein